MGNKVKQNRFRPKPKIKKGDIVVVISGADKGKEGEVLEVLPLKNRAIVADVNVVRKHTKPTAEKQGGINDIPAAIHISNLMLKDPKTGEPTRVGRELVDGKLVRVSKKSGEIIK